MHESTKTNTPGDTHTLEPGTVVHLPPGRMVTFSTTKEAELLGLPAMSAACLTALQAHPQRLAQVAFDRAWEELANLGQCDDKYAAEYQRVRREWLAAESPLPAHAFILDRANIVPAMETPSC